MQRDSSGAEVEFFVPVSDCESVSAARTLASVTRQSVAGWRATVVCDATLERPADRMAGVRWITVPGESGPSVNQFMAASAARWVARLEPGHELHPAFVERLFNEVASNPDWALVYTDHVEAPPAGDKPCFKPDFNLELLRSTPYMGKLAIVRTDLLRQLGGYRYPGAAGVADLAFRAFETRGADAVGHVQDLMYVSGSQRDQAGAEQAVFEELVAAHLARSGIGARIHRGYQSGTVFVEYLHEERPLVSIIIPTKDRPEYIGPCLSSLLQKTTYADFEVLVLDNGTTDPQAREVIDRARQEDHRVRVLSYPYEYNYAAINNYAARQARGRFLLLLNNDTIVVQDNWLDRLLSHAQRPDVGIVGARLVFPNQHIQHAGIVLGMGPNGVADHVHMGLPLTAPGYMNRAQVAQEFSAVTAACLVIRKSVYEAVGGMDEKSLAVLYNDVDLCLKVRELGGRIIWTPFSTLVHHGSGSLKKSRHVQTAGMERAAREAATMLERWLPSLARDPCYNPNLSLIRKEGVVDTEVRAHWDQIENRPRILATSLGSRGSRQHRMCIPLEALQCAGRAACHMLPAYSDRVRVPSPAELAREAPDVLWAHNAVHDVQLAMLENAKRFNEDVFRVFGQDDLMFELPPDNPFRDRVYPDIRERLARAIGSCDRLVVATEPLADAYRSMASDIRVVPNYLDERVWGGLRCRRRRGDRPRFGWAGAQQHGGDLKIVFEVVKATSKEIDWVFFGLCFEEWLEYVAEVHDPVDFDQYPAKLASLDLDCAIAPLACNRFNEAKSNLKILEYGALGIPVVCTDLAPYRGAPVRRVPNAEDAWLEALRERAHDLEATAREGDALRDWVYENWMLGDHLDQWQEALGLADKAPRAASGTGNPLNAAAKAV